MIIWANKAQQRGTFLESAGGLTNMLLPLKGESLLNYLREEKREKGGVLVCL